MAKLEADKALDSLLKIIPTPDLENVRIHIQLQRAKLGNQLQMYHDTHAICLGLLLDVKESDEIAHLAMHHLLRAYEGLGYHEERLGLAQKLAKLESKSVYYHHAIAQSFRGLEQYKDEVDALSNAIELAHSVKHTSKFLKPDGVPIILQMKLERAIALIQTMDPKNIKLAVVELTELLSLSRPGYLVCCALATAYNLQGDMDLEYHFLQEALHHALRDGNYEREMQCRELILKIEITKINWVQVDLIPVPEHKSRSRSRSQSPLRHRHSKSHHHSRSRSRHSTRKLVSRLKKGLDKLSDICLKLN